jgi:hypothetical protein
MECTPSIDGDMATLTLLRTGSFTFTLVFRSDPAMRSSLSHWYFRSHPVYVLNGSWYVHCPLDVVYPIIARHISSVLASPQRTSFGGRLGLFRFPVELS